MNSFCDPAGNRTPNRQIRNLMLYPVELPDQVGCGLGFVCGCEILFSFINLDDCGTFREAS
jgi:hypothetical protein